MGTYSQLLGTKASPAPAKPKRPKRQKPKAAKQAILQPNKQTSNIAILQFDDTDIGGLRQTAYKAQTFRFTHREIEWIKDTAHNLSKEMQRGKVTQVDILRVAMKLFENALATNKAGLLRIFERMK